MAWYTGCELYYRGRLLRVTLRYGSLEGGGIEILRGAPLMFTERDMRRLDMLIDRKPECKGARTLGDAD